MNYSLTRKEARTEELRGWLFSSRYSAYHCLYYKYPLPPLDLGLLHHPASHPQLPQTVHGGAVSYTPIPICGEAVAITGRAY